MNVGIWNTARNASEIESDMNSTLTGSETGLVAYWPLNETSGQQVVNDSTSYGNNGWLGSTTGVDSDDPGWFLLVGPFVSPQ